MNVQEAAAILKKRFPNRKIIGYWEKDDGFIFNTESLVGNYTMEPGQYLVTEDGKVFGMNPMRTELSIQEMRKCE